MVMSRSEMISKIRAQQDKVSSCAKAHKGEKGPEAVADTALCVASK